MANHNRDWNPERQSTGYGNNRNEPYGQNLENEPWSGERRDRESRQGSQRGAYGQYQPYEQTSYSQNGGDAGRSGDYYGGSSQSDYGNQQGAYRRSHQVGSGYGGQQQQYTGASAYNQSGYGQSGYGQSSYGQYGYGNESRYQSGRDPQSQHTQNQGFGVGSNLSYNRGGFGSDYGGEYGYRGNQFGNEGYTGGYNSGSPYGNQYGQSSYAPRTGGSQHDNNREYSSHSGRYDRDQDQRWQRDNRDWFDRAGDEVKSWFGDDEAATRRKMDRRQEEGTGDNRYGYTESQSQHRGRGPKGYRRSDARIEEDINDRLSDDLWLDASDVEVSVKDGEVVLSGTVDNRQAKRHAENLAESISGVLNVENRIRVKREQSVASSSAGNTTTGTTSGAESASLLSAASDTSSTVNSASGATTGRSKTSSSGSAGTATTV